MDTNYQHLPSEIVELIIDFASDPSPQNANMNPGYKHTLLTCALPCKTWLWPARRRLLSLDLRLRTIKVSQQTLLTLFDIFRSPLCTLDPRFIQVLEIAADPGSEVGTTFPIFALLSILDRIPLLSLHTLRFRDVSLNFGKYEDGNSSPGSPAPTLQNRLI